MIDELPDETELIKYSIALADWYASQWDSQSVAIYAGSHPQPIRIIKRPEAWGEHWAWNLCDEGIYLTRVGAKEECDDASG